MKLFDYECPKHGIFEAWGSDSNHESCPECGARSLKLLGNKGVLLSFKDEGFPRAWRMWADEHERETRRQYADPDYYEKSGYSPFKK